MGSSYLHELELLALLALLGLRSQLGLDARVDPVINLNILKNCLFQVKLLPVGDGLLDFGCLLRLDLLRRDDLVPVDLGDLSGLGALGLGGRLVLRLDLQSSLGHPIILLRRQRRQESEFWLWRKFSALLVYLLLFTRKENRGG